MKNRYLMHFIRLIGMVEKLLLSALNSGDIETARYALRMDKSLLNTYVNGSSLLHLAVLRGSIDLVAMLIDEGVNVNALSTDGRTPLDVAIERRDHAISCQLIENGGDIIKLKKNPKWTILHAAANTGTLPLVDYLVGHGTIPLGAQDDYGRTALHVAIEVMNRHTDEVPKLLIDKGAPLDAQDKIRQTPLHLVIKRGYEGLAKLLIDRGANLDVDRVSDTPLSIAIWHMETKLARLLIEGGASVNNGLKTPLEMLVDQDGYCGVHDREAAELSKLLIKRGADVNHFSWSESSGCNTLLDHYTFRSSKERPLLKQVLTSNGAVRSGDLVSFASQGDIDKLKVIIDRFPMLLKYRSGNKDSLLHYGICQEAIVLFLLKAGKIDVNAEGDGRQTPLHRAAKEGNFEVIRILLENGAHINAKDIRGQTPLHHAFDKPRISDNQLMEVVVMLLKNGADVNAQDRRCWCPVHLAARRNKVGLVQLLLDKGADASIVARENVNWWGSLIDKGGTPLEIAKANNCPDVVRLLQERMRQT